MTRCCPYSRRYPATQRLARATSPGFWVRSLLHFHDLIWPLTGVMLTKMVGSNVYVQASEVFTSNGLPLDEAAHSTDTCGTKGMLALSASAACSYVAAVMLAAIILHVEHAHRRLSRNTQSKLAASRKLAVCTAVQLCLSGAACWPA
jgi:hypothetical protein